MSERMLITKLVRQPDGTVDLIARGHRFKDTTLFDLTDLADVGIDYEALPMGVETPCRFWALYETSEKLNQAGNPYKDVIALEPMDQPATSSSPDPSALLQELREELRDIKTLLLALVDERAVSKIVIYGDDQVLDPTNTAEVAAFEAYCDRTGHRPTSRQDLRDWWRQHGQNANGSAKPRRRPVSSA